MRRRAPRPLSAALEGLARELRPHSTLAAVQALWSDAAGPAISREAHPVAERAGEVTVACSGAVWAQELELMSSELLGSVNAALEAAGEGPRLRSLRFTAGRRPPSL